MLGFGVLFRWLPVLIGAPSAIAAQTDTSFVVEANVPVSSGRIDWVTYHYQVDRSSLRADSAGGFRTYSFPFAKANVWNMCLETGGADEFRLRNARLETGGRVTPVALEDFQPASAIEELSLIRERGEYSLRVRPKSGATPVVCVAHQKAYLAGGHGLGAAALMAMLAATLAFFGVATWTLLRGTFEVRWLALFLLILFAKLAVVNAFGSSVPWADQWLFEWDSTYRPWVQDRLTPEALLAPHNEHRLPFLRMAAIVLFEGNGLWDVRLESAFEALFHAAVLTGFAMVLGKAGGHAIAKPAMILIASIGALPLGWESVPGGFLTQIYQLVAAAILALGLLSLSKPWTASWWLGFAVSLLGGLTTASGALIAVAAVAALLLERRAVPRKFAMLALLAISAAIGVSLIASAPHHGTIRATSAGVLMMEALRHLAWPLDGAPYLAPLVWLPFAAMLWRLRDRAWSGLERLLVSTGLFAILTAGALAYARGGAQVGISSRYVDLLSLGLVANACALVVSWPRRRGWASLACAAWCVAMGVGVALCAHRALVHELPRMKADAEQRERALARFLREGSREAIFGKPASALPFSDPVWLEGFLRSPRLRSMMPPGVREPDAPLPFPSAGSWSAVCEAVLRNAWIGVVASAVALLGVFRRRAMLAIALAGIPIASAQPDARFVVEAEIAARGDKAQFITDHDGVADRAYLPVADTAGFQTYSFPFATRNVVKMCFQPMSRAGEFSLRNARLEVQGRSAAISLEKFLPYLQISEVALVPAQGAYALRVRTEPGAAFPTICIRDPIELLEPARGLGPVAVWSIMLACVAFVLLAVAALAREVHRHGLANPLRWNYCYWAALFLLIAGAKLTIVDGYASSLANWDQWLLEWDLVYRPYIEGRLGLPPLLAAHSEHRVPFVRLAAIVFLDANGIWDVRLEAAVDALLHAAALTGLATMLWKLGGGRFRWPAMIVAACAGALPIGVESTTGGFHTQNFYQIVALAILSLGLLSLAEPLSRRWWLGWACSLCGGLVIASGALIPLAAAGAILLSGKVRGRAGVALLALAVSAGAGLALIGAAPHHEQLKTPSLWSFVAMTGRNLAWPMDSVPAVAPLLWLPWCVYWMVTRAKEPRDRFIIAIGVWTILNAAALSYGRSGPIPSRYQDLLSPGMIVNGFAMLWLVLRDRRVIAFTVPWVLLISLGLHRTTFRATHAELPAKLVRSQTQERNVARFLRQGDRSALYGQPFEAIPFPDAALLDGFLRSPRLRSMMPAVVREADAPLPSPRAGWLSGISEAVLRRAWMVAAGAIALLLALVARDAARAVRCGK